MSGLSLAVALMAPAAWAYNEFAVYSFKGQPDGALPFGAVNVDSAGNIYGTTWTGGQYLNGTVFRISPTGAEVVLHSFSGGDGALPEVGLVGNSAGDLFGATYLGGAFNYGTIFKINTNGKETVLHSFTGGADGAYPSGLIRDGEGNLYGTASFGGAASGDSGFGVVFKIDRTGAETVLYTFTGGSDGSHPYCGLLRDSTGNLYGTTGLGGAGFGVVFRLDSGGTESVLHSFTGADGYEPDGALIQDEEGNLYGTTVLGGAAENGVVFKIDTSNNESVLHSFTGGVDGADPVGNLYRDKAGNLFGITNAGGSFGVGVVYKLDAASRLTVVHAFANGLDGGSPQSGLTRDHSGNLYGTATYGGSPSAQCAGEQPSCGVVFRLTP